MKCPNCQTVNPDDAKFCENCGNALEKLCPNCGKPVSPNSKFCRNCGYRLVEVAAPAASAMPTATVAASGAPSVPAQAQLDQYIPKELLNKLETARANRAMQGERRVVTVLFCDVKGSTAMAERLDPEEWAEIMNSAFERLI